MPASILQAQMRDPYKVIGVNSNATSREIKKAYYQLAKKYHPDVNKEQGAEQRFHDIQAAYELLSDETKKQQYDNFGAAAFEQGGASQRGDSPFGGQAHNFSFHDLFNQAFGSHQRPRGPMMYKGDNVEVTVSVTLEEVSQGATKDIEYSTMDECGTCHGSGLAIGKHKHVCPSCQGSGSTIHMIHGGFRMASTCSTCSGSGMVIPRSSACRTCDARGVVRVTKKNMIDVPVGASDGLRLRVLGQGHSPEVLTGNDDSVRVQKGDLIVQVHVKPHKLFQRDRSNILYTASVPMTTAALGGKIEVPSLVRGPGQPIRLRIQAATQSGMVITIPDEGLAMNVGGGRGTSHRGALKVTIKVQVPRPLTASQTALLEALADEIKDTTARRKTVMSPEKVKTYSAQSNKEEKPREQQPEEETEHRNGTSLSSQYWGYFKSLFYRLFGQGKNQ